MDEEVGVDAEEEDVLVPVREAEVCAVADELEVPFVFVPDGESPESPDVLFPEPVRDVPAVLTQ